MVRFRTSNVIIDS